MTERIKKRYRAIFVLAVVCLISGLAFLYGNGYKTVEGEAIPYETIKEEYVRGERITVTGAKIYVDGEGYDSNKFELYYPDGSAYGKSEAILSDTGVYKIKYYAEVSGKTLTAVKKFTVKNPLFETTKETATSVYTEKLNLIRKVGGEKEENSYIEKSGIHAEITDSSEFVYNEPINLKELGGKTPFVRFYPYNRSAYAGGDGWQCDANSIILKLTDCYDSSNYVEIEISYDASDTTVPDKKDPYLRAGASNQTKTGFSPISASYNAGYRKSFYVGEQRYVSVTGMYGARDTVNWTDNADDTGFEFIYDYDTNCVYLRTRKLYNKYRVAKEGETGTHFYVNYIRNEKSGTYYFDTEKGEYALISEKLKTDPDFIPAEKYGRFGYYLTREEVLKYDPDYITNPPPKETVVEAVRDGYKSSAVATLLIADLDNEEAFDETFKGFKTGEVFFSVYGTDYENSVLRFEIDEIAGKTGEELNRATVTDKTMPVIEADERIEKTESRYIIRGEKFVIPKVTAFDVNLKGSVKTEVFFDYGSSDQLSVGIFDGAFQPKKVGVYTVVYTAEDCFGNVTRLLMPFVSVRSEIGKTITFSADAPSDKVYAGVETVLPRFAFDALNGNENVYVKAFIRYEKTGETTELNDSLAVTFVNAGKYTVNFLYGDLFYDYEYSYEVDVQPSDAVGFKEGVLPDYFIKGATYTVDKVYAMTYRGEETKNEAEVFVSEDGGEFYKIDPTGYVVKANSTVNFRYSFAGSWVNGSKTVKVVDVGYGDVYRLENYFVGDFGKNAVFNGITFSSEKTVGDNSLEFVNVLSLSAFSMQFSIPEELSNYKSFEIKLTDYYDRTRFVTLTYAKGNTGIEFNGRTVSGGFTDTRTLAYSAERGVFTGQAEESYRFDNNFTSDRVLLTLTLKGINGESGFFMRSLNGQSINSTDYDYVMPTIWYDLTAKGIKKHGEVIKLVPGIPFDVLSPYDRSKFSFSVVTPSGRYATAKNGTVLDVNCDSEKTYEIELTEFGTYSVNYVYTDYCGNRSPISFNIKVVDEVAPKIVLENGYNEKTVEKVKVGETVKIKKYTVTDDMSKAENVVVGILLLTPNNEMVSVSDSFVATEKGDYVVIYGCYDEFDNYTVIYYTVRAD